MIRNNTSKKELDKMIDRVTDQIRKEELDAAVVDSAAERVWARLSQSSLNAESPIMQNISVDKIRNCNDFQLLIPAYLNDKLTDSRKMLFEDHTRECLVCRKALKAVRSGESIQSSLPAAVMPATPKRSYSVYRYAAAALIFIALGLFAVPFLIKWGTSARASVQAVDGQVYRVASSQNYAIQSGAELKEDELIRTSKDADAVVRLSDGSIIEMNERSEFYISEDNSGITIHLKKGNIIVQAAKQRSRHLYVATDDCRVAVTGTIFSVNNGTKGSRVSVIEGEVKVEQNGETHVLHPGQQRTTTSNLEQIPLQDEIAWSRNSDQYLKMLGALNSISKEIKEKVPMPPARYSTRLLDLVTDGTVFYAALPNLSESLSESYSIMQERIEQNPALKEFLAKNNKNQRAELDMMIGKIRDFGQYIGNEIVITAQVDPKGEPMAPMIMANVNRPLAFRAFLDQQVAQLASSNGLKIMIVEDPQSIFYEVKPDLYIWIGPEMMAISTDAVPISMVGITLIAGTNRFVASPFYKRISEVYKDGAGMIFAADLERVMTNLTSKDPNAAKKTERNNLFKKVGLSNLKHLILEQREVNGQSRNRATITFNEKRKGIAAWLANPGPMGTLDFISPDANVAGAFVIKEPATLVDEMFGYLDNFDPKFREYINKMESEHGISVSKDFAANIGGEFAFAVDGPLLPMPSWKLIFEVNDPISLQQSFEKLFAELNRQAVSAGKAGFNFEQEEIDGRIFYSLSSIDTKLEINYCYIDGYFVAAPSRALIDRAIKFRESGYSLPRSENFISALPEDGNANFSAIYYHNLAPVLGPLAQTGLLGNLSKESQQAVKSLSEGKPVLACAYAYGDRIVFAMNTDGPFGINPNSLMLGLPGALSIEKLFEQTMKK